MAPSDAPLDASVEAALAAHIETAEVEWTISVKGVDDLPSVTSMAFAFDEDGVAGGHALLLNLSDFELNQVLAGHVTKLPAKGTLYSLDDDGGRTAITEAFNPFDVGMPVVRQFLSRVLAKRRAS